MDQNKLLKKIKNKVSGVFLLAILIFFMPGSVHADVLSDRLADVTSSTDETSFVNAVLNLAIPVAVFCLFGLGIYAGYNMLTSQGNPEKINEAREIITNAVLGFALIGLSVAVLLLIQDILKIPWVTP